MAELLPEKWMKGVAITTTVLAGFDVDRFFTGGILCFQITGFDGSSWKSVGLLSSQKHKTEFDRNAA